MKMEDSVRKEFFELLSFESVSADPAKFKDCLNCASWLRKWLGTLGFEGELLYPSQKPDAGECPPPPVLFAERKGDENASTVLFYAHYDVQPADPVEKWTTPPFEPTLVDGRIRCRGANDDKGQFFSVLCGLRDLIASGAKGLPTIKIILDGQEESESVALTKIIPDIRKRLAADVLLVADTAAAADLRPAIVAGLRGVGSFTLRLVGPDRDLHSGAYGGIAPNPAQGLAELLASLHHADGSIAVTGFRDGIELPSREELEVAEASAKSEQAYADDMGCAAAGGQVGQTIVQRNSFEPTIEVNGIHSGYGGPGSKTVIPSEAIAKISMRLVPGQSPRGAFAAVRKHLESRCPRGMTLSFESVHAGISGFRLPLGSPVFRLAAGVLSEMDPRGPVFQWDGASIPILSVIREASGAAPLIVGWGQAEDRIHSPDESYSIRQFDRGRDWAKRILSEL